MRASGIDYDFSSSSDNDNDNDNDDESACYALGRSDLKHEWRNSRQGSSLVDFELK